MSASPAALVIGAYIYTHERILNYLRKLPDAQLYWQLTPDTLSIAWHGWHLARWADHIQACVPGMTPELGQRLGQGVQVWHADSVAAQWGFDPAQLGWGETGMTMPDEVATRLPFPPKDRLLDYVAKAFAAAERNIAAIDDQQFGAAEQPQPMTEGIWGEGTVGDAVMSHLTHANRHFGMIECLLGLQGQHGSASSYDGYSGD
jgi:hypothetical protein